MNPRDLEPELDELLHRFLPNLDQEWKGASDEQIAAIEKIAGRELPRFYRWFLMRMGGSMKPVVYPTLDFSASKILSCYANGTFVPNGRFLMIGYSRDDIERLHTAYDFDTRVGEDFAVVSRSGDGEDVYRNCESFRDMIAWAVCSRGMVRGRPFRCEGTLTHGEDVLPRLGPLLAGLGMKQAVSTGHLLGIFESENACMIALASTNVGPEVYAFDLAGEDRRTLRSILGAIKAEGSLEVENVTWKPPVG